MHFMHSHWTSRRLVIFLFYYMGVPGSIPNLETEVSWVSFALSGKFLLSKTVHEMDQYMLVYHTGTSLCS
jgi:hypothetical protein